MKKIVLFAIFILIIIFTTSCIGSSGSSQSSYESDYSSSSSSSNKGDITIPSGKLSDYINSYSSYDDVYVKQIDGTVDSRANDLEELCKDWLYYRKKIVEAENAGDKDRANDYRVSFNNVNDWLDDYKESDVTAMFEILEKQGYSPP